MKYLISKASKERGYQEMITSALDSGQEPQIVTKIFFAWRESHGFCDDFLRLVHMKLLNFQPGK